MEPDQWDSIVELFHAAREKTGGERLALLDSLCGGEQSLRALIEQMLRDDEATGSFLDRPPIAALAAASRGAPIAAGASFGRYEIVAPIGRGGMGEVWVARDTELGRQVALKFLAPEAAFSDAERPTREAMAASALNHPNIVTVHEVIRHEDTRIIVMELVEGTALRAVSGSPQPLDRVIHFGLQIARALAVAHASGLVHCDIKPENILVRPDGYIKVVDFGLARRVAIESIAAGSVSPAGTLRYMSPEQARGDSLTPASDVFSFGLVLYELATGRHAFPSHSPLCAGVHPFSAASEFEILHAIANQDPKHLSALNPEIPAELDSLVLAMLGKDPAARPSAEQIARKLTGLATPATSGSTRSVYRGWAVFAALLAAIGVVIWLITQNPQSVTDLKIRPLTSQPGWETFPALSPDGKSVAFCWTDTLDRSRQIYVKHLDSDKVAKLTDSGSDGIIGSLTWSPDGSQIAFKRSEGGSGAIYSLPKSGGTPKQILRLSAADSSSTIDWSPDGGQLAFSDVSPGSRRFSIYLFDIRTGEKRQLTYAPVGHWGDWSPTFSADGRTIAFKRVTTYWVDEIYLVPSVGGTVRQVTTDKRGIWGHAWMTDNSLVLACQRNGSVFGLWQIPVLSPNRGHSLAAGGIDAIMPTVARKANRIAWVNQLEDINIYQILTNGTGKPTQLVASTARDLTPDYSPDGRIAFVSDRSGSVEIWIARPDGSDQVRVTNLNGPPIGCPRWSPDGRRLAFDSRPLGRSVISVMACESLEMRCSEPRQLTTGQSAQVLSSWSADGKFLYFASDRTGRWEAWKQPVAGGPSIQVTHSGGYTAFESHNGRWLYFSKPEKSGQKSIWRAPGPRGDPTAAEASELLIRPDEDIGNEGWRVTPDEIFFVSRDPTGRSETIRAYNLASGRIRPILTLTNLLPERAATSVAVSPDSHWLLFSRVDRSGSNVMVADFGDRLGL